MILFLIFVLLTYAYECFKPPIQSCEGAQQLIDCGIYYGRVLANQINDIYTGVLGSNRSLKTISTIGGGFCLYSGL